MTYYMKFGFNERIENKDWVKIKAITILPGNGIAFSESDHSFEFFSVFWDQTFHLKVDFLLLRMLIVMM